MCNITLWIRDNKIIHFFIYKTVLGIGNFVKHATHKPNISINRAIHKMQGYNITLTTTQVQEAIKQSNNNNSQGPEKLNIRHLKHIDPL